MKKLTFALFVAAGAMMFVSCGPKMDTPENVGKSVLEAFQSQDAEKVGDLYVTKEDMTALFDEAGKVQMDSMQKAGFEAGKKMMVEGFDMNMAKEKTESFSETNKDAIEANINWEKVEFVRVESKEEMDLGMKTMSGKVFFKTETGTEFYLRFSAVQIEDSWKIVAIRGIGQKK
ncbi:MAG: hypothetical protein RIR06_1114 [Bacteroidota bacterium]|jgi:hypothetical protein